MTATAQPDGAARAPSPPDESLDGLKAQILELRTPIPARSDPRKKREAELLQLVLEKHAAQINGRDTLRSLISLHLSRIEPGEARSAVERFAERVGLRTWEKAKSIAEIEATNGGFDEYRRWMAVVVDEAEAPEAERCGAAWGIASSWYQQLRPKECIEACRDLLERFGESASPAVQVTCKSARGQIEFLAGGK